MRVAVLGAGRTGPVIARVAMDAGYRASIAASGDPKNITTAAAPGAERRWVVDAVGAADLVVLAIPLHRFATVDPALLDGKLVVDTMNHWPPVDGVLASFDGTSEIVARRLAGSTVVKTLNHIGYHDLEDDRRPPGSPQRRALGVAGDDAGAVDTVAEVIERIGYDAVRLGSLRAGRLLEPGGPLFGGPLTRAEFEVALSAAA